MYYNFAGPVGLVLVSFSIENVFIFQVISYFYMVFANILGFYEFYFVLSVLQIEVLRAICMAAFYEFYFLVRTSN